MDEEPIQTNLWNFMGQEKEEEPAVRLSGDDEYGPIFEWYGDTGGQLKYYPLAQDALWVSTIFQLEPLPTSDELEYGIIAKTRTYFPDQWKTALNSDNSTSNS